MSGRIGLDFETYSAVDLNKHGLYRYMKDSSFTPLLGGLVDQDGARFRFSFVHGDRGAAIRDLHELIADNDIVSHNAIFEEMVLHHLGLVYPASRFIDSAVIARAVGAGGKLEAAAPQLLGTDKMDSGKNLIKLFSVPGKYQEAEDTSAFVPQVTEDYASEWLEFGDYCLLDAELGLFIAEQESAWVTDIEHQYQVVTQRMNHTGWPVDVRTVEEMHRRYLENQDKALADFRIQHGAADLNLNSLKQMKEWCAERGVKAESFDEKHVASLLARLEKRLAAVNTGQPLAVDKHRGYKQVVELLRTKQILGGSSLKKLAVILDTTWDGRLRDQYLHCGAGQTLRTTGRGAQMQNLKQITVPADMDQIHDPSIHWDNERMAANIRQCFTSRQSDGLLIVGDLKSVESRGLAWLAGETWKLDAYKAGADIYQLTARKIYGIRSDLEVTKQERQGGKAGELSCGYQAGPEAVMSFASKMGIEITEAEAQRLVWDWRDANPKIVEFWAILDEMLHDVVEGSSTSRLHYLYDNLVLQISKHGTPASLVAQHPRAQTISMTIRSESSGLVLMRRYFHGCYVRGRNICYYKPSDRKTGDLWRNNYTDPKTKRLRWYELYGGKLAGILTQSFCRELFMRCLLATDEWCRQFDNLDLIGQFHDEAVVDWVPGPISSSQAMDGLRLRMSDSSFAPSFPLEATVKTDYRYTK